MEVVAEVAARAEHLVDRYGFRTVKVKGGTAPVEDDVRKAGGEAAFIACDVTDSAAVNAAVEQTVERFGRLDVVVNNAGGAFRGLFPDESDESWLNTIALNLNGTFFMCRAAWPHLVAAGGGSIVNVTTLSAVAGVGRDQRELMGGQPPLSYTASKAGVEGLTVFLAGVGGTEGIRVNAVRPGRILTSRYEQLMGEGGIFWPYYKVNQMLKQHGRSEDVANAILFLASDEAKFITAEILDAHPNGVVAALGDTVQVAGTAAEFRDCYAPTWGRHKARTRPTIGNHEYLTDLGKAYWDYFGSAAGPAYKGWYSYDLGPSWHVVVLNSDCWRTGGCEKGKPQEAWLRADLAANARPCTLVYFHKPLFSSIEGEPGMRAIWDTLYEFNADLVLNGHKHGYERFAPQRPDGTRDSARGIREIVVATGGSPEFYPYGAILPTSEVHATQVHGVLDLTLTATGYRFNFLPAADTTFTDSGSGTCH